MNALLSLVALAILTLLSEILNFKKILQPLVFIGLAVAFSLNLLDWNNPERYYNDMMYFNNYSVAFTALLIVVTFFWFIHSSSYFVDRPSARSDKYALILFSLIGGVVLASFSHMVMFFIGVEILSIPMYILAGSRKKELASNEAAMKYFLMGAFATGIMLFGITLMYGASGTFHLQGITKYVSDAQIQPIFYVGLTLLMISIAFKISAVPFHFWTPDVYHGSPTIVTTFMATVVKTSAFAAFFRLFESCFVTLSPDLSLWIGIIAALTILVGNITAVYQDSVKRMLAYSSIAHAGYMLIAVVAMNEMSSSSILLYATAYSLSTIVSFSILIIIMKAKNSDSFTSFNGLLKTNPFLAFAAIVAMLSLAGIPPTAGFFAKYYIFSAALKENFVWLVLIGVLGSLIGVYYYFKLIIAICKPTPEDHINPSIESSFAFDLVLIICAGLSIGLGIFPNFLIGLI